MSPVVRLCEADVLWREVAGEVVAANLTTSTYLSLNRTGTALWEVLSEPADVEELVALLVERFEVTETTARADVDAFVQDLIDSGLAEYVT